MTSTTHSSTAVSATAAADRTSSSTRTEHVVHVHWDGDTLEITPSDVEIALGDIVVWVFTELQDGQGFRLVFEASEELGAGQGLGPFACLHRTETSLRGEGNTGIAGAFPYQVMIVDAVGVELGSAVGAVTNTADVVDSTPLVEIHVDLEACGQGACKVEPDLLSLYPDGIVLFEFHGLDPSTVPFLDFGLAALESGDVEPAGQLGPFAALEQSANQIIGHGFDGRFGRFGYQVGVIVVDGDDFRRVQLKISQDPVLDRLPDPVGTVDY